MVVTKAKKCPKCLGTGRTKRGTRCKTCKGTGEVVVSQSGHIHAMPARYAHSQM